MAASHTSTPGTARRTGVTWERGKWAAWTGKSGRVTAVMGGCSPCRLLPGRVSGKPGMGADQLGVEFAGGNDGRVVWPILLGVRQLLAEYPHKPLGLLLPPRHVV